MPGPVSRLLGSLGDGDAVADEDLLARVAEDRDSTAFELLLRRHADLVWRVCRRIAHDHQEAEDAFQAAFLALATHARTVRGCVAGWLYRVAYNAAIRAKARTGRLRPAGALDDQPEAVASASAERSEMAPILHDELASLPGKYRDPLVLCYLDGLSQSEAADRLGLPLGTVATRIRRGGKQLRARLARRGVAPAAGGLAALFDSSGKAAAALIVQTARLTAAPASQRPAAIVHLMNGAMTTVMKTQTNLVLVFAVGLVLSVGGLVAAFGYTKGRPPATPEAAANTPGLPPPGGGGTPGGRPVADPSPGVRVPEKLTITPGEQVADARQRVRSGNNLKQIVQAMQNYTTANREWPSGIKDKQGRLLLSWRVQILPYMNNGDLYKKFKLDEPWDGPTNKPLLGIMPAVFKTGIEANESADTYYQTFAGVGTMCDASTKVVFPASIPDGTSDTLAVAEMGPPVPWTKPVDVEYSTKKPLPELKLPFKNLWMVAMADGRATPLRVDIDAVNLRRLAERADGGSVDVNKLQVPPAALDLSAPGEDKKGEKIDAKKLIGKWEPREKKGGESFAFEFMKDGKLTVTINEKGKESNLDGTYKADGNVVTMAVKIGKKQENGTLTVFKLTDTELVGADGRGKVTAFVRIKDK